ncbi:hypothetical protein Pcar_2479 [Syntrophotalea carbinolica DSM 2380]|uniref:Uncharacterized protein n=1 Tax=Syntrophotalea carbinolica (strain DSM 2380 / NBRC 103641 / GraBd1) TaxID=338963 RepID=Q3A1N9_SYNC1|nr:hypothetical protein [Syntrophotalea carbinolica]ABA89718.1 hypothetical protein Pcar_2479 [Syntrophotalea carbinolica DSM 2380]
MKGRNVNSYNLVYARQILSTLAPRKQAQHTATFRQEPRSFVRLSAQKKLAKAAQPSLPEPPDATTPGTSSVDAPSQPFADWESCIAWCMGVTRAESAFVVDSQGFVIAMRGRIPGHGFECTGAELIYAMDQLERIDPEAGRLLWIDLDFNKRRLVGFVTPGESAEYFIVGLVAPDASYNASKHVMSKHIIANLANMN